MKEKHKFIFYESRIFSNKILNRKLIYDRTWLLWLYTVINTGPEDMKIQKNMPP